MKPDLFTLIAFPIISSFSLLILPDILLLSWHTALLFNLPLVMTALYCYWFNYLFLTRLIIYLCGFIICLAFTHSQALTLLHQADQIARTLPNIQTELKIEEILHQKDYQTLIASVQLSPNIPPQRLLVNWKHPERPFIGEIWNSEIKLKSISSRLNFGGFDRQKWYLSKKITARTTITKATKKNSNYSWRQQKLYQALQQTTNLPRQGLLLALGFGERAWLPSDMWQEYQQTNTAHLLAISGLHIGLAMAIGFYLTRAIQYFFPARFITPTFPILIGLSTAALYAYFAGFNIPTRRALSALVIVCTIRLSRRYYSPFQYFYLVIGFLLLFEPLMILSNSFWLSISAVGVLLIWYHAFPISLIQWQHRPLFPKALAILSLVHLQIGLFLLFTPIQLLLFNGFSLNGIIANLIIVPIFSFILVPLVLFAVLSNGAFFSWQIADYLVHLTTNIIQFLQGQWVTFSINSVFILTALFLALFGSLLWLAYFFTNQKSQSHQLTKLIKRKGFTFHPQYFPFQTKSAFLPIFSLLFPAIIGLLIIPIYRILNRPTWQLETLDVGQGLATLIVKNGRGVLYDSGASWRGGSMAELEILPYLQREGIKLEMLILSHDDNDHAGGATPLLTALPNIKLITPSLKYYPHKNNKIDRTFCQKDISWQWQGLMFRVLSPPQKVTRAKNADSCVILLQDKQHKILLTGDADRLVERQIAVNAGKIDILQIGHHGSKTSTSEFLLSRTKPKIGLISSGKHNPWKFPHIDVLERLKRYQVQTKNTADVGQIRINFYEKSVQIQTARTLFSPWYARPIGLSEK
ncbi:DNA internalization-related competence protein ComEC/Rec2 [Rodentibacter caecimuris]|uniref:DNA internalization-related competence protein ComEC/Rec2 n=1 Tax=Rodentibacter caecimuris TaxID=1796644 RepID=A0ABX3KYJ1_9PAST|nr:DNA internalization-related competence protein ComEC/Rec2 [Rodentibacter heylii]